MIIRITRQTFRVAKRPECRQATLPVVAVAVIAAYAASAAPMVQAQAAPKQPVQTEASPSTGSEDKSPEATAVIVPATVQAFFATDLYAKDSGYISQVGNDIGDHVRKGQVLAVIEDPELQAQFDRAQAAVLQAKAALNVAERQVGSMQADLVLQQVTLKRQKELFAGKAATAQSLDEAQSKESVSKANLETEKAKILLADANVRAANAEVERLQALLHYDKVVAPFDGVVTRRLVNPGDLVQAATATRTTPLFTVQDLDLVRVFADVPEANAAGIQRGQAAEIKLYGTAAAIHGTVTRIATALDPESRTMRVEIDLPNPDETLLPGAYAQVTLGGELQQAQRPSQHAG
jgi:multidrug efflux pump subunit AcrA (membrane-fusion protein)